jgi:hypothetical protein
VFLAAASNHHRSRVFPLLLSPIGPMLSAPTRHISTGTIGKSGSRRRSFQPTPASMLGHWCQVLLSFTIASPTSTIMRSTWHCLAREPHRAELACTTCHCKSEPSSKGRAKDRLSPTFLTGGHQDYWLTCYLPNLAYFFNKLIQTNFEFKIFYIKTNRVPSQRTMLTRVNSTNV